MKKMYAIRTPSPNRGKLNGMGKLSTWQSERTTFAIFVRFVGMGMTQSKEGNGWENGAVSLGAALYPLFPCLGSHSVIQDVSRKVLF